MLCPSIVGMRAYGFKTTAMHDNDQPRRPHTPLIMAPQKARDQAPTSTVGVPPDLEGGRPAAAAAAGGDDSKGVSDRVCTAGYPGNL